MTDTTQGDQGAEHQDAGEDAPETVALAREMGWKPEAEWKGDPPKGGFHSATEFLRRGEKILPIVRADAKKAKEEAAALRSEMEQMRNDHRDTIKRIERMSNVALEQQRLQITNQYTAAKEAAVEVGDKVAYREADKAERESLKAIDDRLKENDADSGGKKDERKTAEMPREVKEVLDGWLAENTWFNSDEELNAVAQARHMKLLREKKGLTLRQNLDEVREYVKKRFPEHFADEGDEQDEDDPPRRKGSPVEGGSRLGGGNGGSKFSKLPAEAKAAADKFIKEDKLFLDAGETPEKNLAQARERYATQYFGDMK